MKRLLALLAFVIAFTDVSPGQAPDLTTITGTLYRPSGAPCANCRLILVRSRKGRVPLTTTATTITANANGEVTFTAVRGSITTIRGDFRIGAYDFSQGLDMYIPDQTSALLTDLDSVEDALNLLSGGAGYAPLNATYITQTPSGSLSDEQALSSLATGLLKNTNSTGVLTIAVAGEDYELPLTFNAPLSRATNTISLSNSGAVPGTYTHATITVDQYGRVTEAANGLPGITVEEADLSPSVPGISTLRFDPVDGFVVTNPSGSIARVDLAGVPYSALTLTNSIVNSDISSSAAIALSKLATVTASRALVSDGSGAISASNVTSAELEHLSGVTSPIQTQLNAKAATNHNHAIADITALQLTLDGKAASSHTHSASDITSDLIDTARLGSGTASTTTFLRGDQTWATVNVSPGGSNTYVQYNNDGVFGGSANFTFDGSNAVGITGTLTATANSSSATPLIVKGAASQSDNLLELQNSSSTVLASFSSAGVFTKTSNGIGTTSTDGIVLENTTAAAANAQQYSPRIRLTGQGWKTNATAASQTVDWVIENRPVQGAAAPVPSLVFGAQVNGGGYNTYVTFNASPTGTITLAAFSRLQLGTLAGASNSIYYNSSNGWAIYELGSTTQYGHYFNRPIQIGTVTGGLSGAPAYALAAAGGAFLEFGSATDKFLIRGAASQSANLLELRDSSGTALASFSSSGALNTTSSITQSTTNAAATTLAQITENVILSTSGATTDTTIDLPANSLILAVTARVTADITDVDSTTIEIGDATTPARFGSGSTLTEGATIVGLNHMQGGISADAAGPVQSSATKIRITLSGGEDNTPSAGAVRVTIHYISLTPPTS